MSNLTGIARKSQPPPSEHWEGACVLQLDYNVLFFSGRTAYLRVVNEKVSFNKSIKKLRLCFDLAQGLVTGF